MSSNAATASTSFTVSQMIARTNAGSQASGTGGPSQPLVMRWLAAGVPLTLLMDLVNCIPQHSFDIVRRETEPSRASQANPARGATHLMLVRAGLRTPT